MKVVKTIPAVIILIAALLLSLVVKGAAGNPLYYQKTLDTRVGGPYESSNSTSRYALAQAIVEDHTLFFSEKLASFAAPDIVHYRNKYFSLFLPGVSFFAVPFYYLGKLFGIPQLTSYFSTTILALINALLITLLARMFKAGNFTSLLSGLAFLFATNALPYSQTMTQHHATLALVLLAVYSLFLRRDFFSDLLLGIVFGLAILVDVPNILMFVPIFLYAFLRHFRLDETESTFKLTVNPTFIIFIVGVVPFAAVLGWYNFQTTGSFAKMGQFIGRSNFPAPVNAPKAKKPVTPLSIYESKLPLDSRNILNGFYTLLISDERGIFYYNSIITIGILGLVLLYKKREKIGLLNTILAVCLTTLLTYSMFDDPWGGWSFGPRYLMPVTGLLTIFIGPLLERFKKNILAIVLFFSLTFYGVYVNTLGVLETTAIPPKQEAQYLISPVPYTYEYNKQLMAKNVNDSLFYNVYLRGKISSQQYLYIYLSMIMGLVAVTYIVGILIKNPE